MSLTQPIIDRFYTDKAGTKRHHRLRAWFLSWEVYLILLVSGFLRLYQINTTEFDDDQALLFRMAHDAIAHGLLPTTSNVSSISIAHPPVAIYLFMLPAALSANPLGGAMLVGILSTVAVLLTYFFTRRYYGRLAGSIAALLYATAAWPLLFARFIWQPNLMAPFVVLFLFTLFWGAVEHRKGWLFPALFLLGVIYQLHETTLSLVILVLITLLLAPGTVRWRDLFFGCISLCVLYFPFLLWELSTRFADLHTVLHLSKQPARIDNQAFNYYQLFLTPYGQQPASADALIRLFIPVLVWVGRIVQLLVALGFVIVVVDIVRLHFKRVSWTRPESKVVEDQENGEWTGWKRVQHWWVELRSSPYRRGLVLLLAWQLIPVLALTRHTISLHPQYLLVLMPGPFILISLFIIRIVEVTRRHGFVAGPFEVFLRYGMYAVAILVISSQLLASTASVIDIGSGKFSDRGFYFDYYNELTTLQHALGEADQLAQQQHLNRVYITTDSATQTALRYLAEQMRTPTTLFDAGHCLVLPNPVDGPAVLLVGPYARLTNALLNQFAAARLVDQLQRPGGLPFRLFIVAPPTAQPSTKVEFGHDLQLLGKQAEHLQLDNSIWQVTRWNFLRSVQPSYRIIYNYVVSAFPDGSSARSEQSMCIFTAIQAGDQLLVAFNLGGSSLTLGVQSFSTVPYNPFYGPFHLETAAGRNTLLTTLWTAEGRKSITIAGSS